MVWVSFPCLAAGLPLFTDAPLFNCCEPRRVWYRNSCISLCAGTPLLSKTDNTLSKLVHQGLASLLTGLALLLSAIIQARTIGLTIYHALLILNINWITIILTIVPYSVTLALTVSDKTTANARERLDYMFLAHIVHFTSTAVFGLWVFFHLETFDITPMNCTPSTVFYLARYFRVVDGTFRRFWKAIYFVAVFPALNVIAVTIALYPILFLSAFTIRILEIIQAKMRKSTQRNILTPSRTPSAPVNPLATRQKVCVLLAASLLIALLIVSTEKTIHANSVAPGENQWSLGQTLALLLTVPRALDVVIVVQRRIRVFRTPAIDIGLPNTINDSR